MDRIRPIHMKKLFSALEYINSRYDCSDFVLAGIIRLYYQLIDSDLISREFKEAAKKKRFYRVMRNQKPLGVLIPDDLWRSFIEDLEALSSPSYLTSIAKSRKDKKKISAAKAKKRLGINRSLLEDCEHVLFAWRLHLWLNDLRQLNMLGWIEADKVAFDSRRENSFQHRNYFFPRAFT